MLQNKAEYRSVQCWQKSLLEPLEEEARRKDLKKYLYDFERRHEPGYRRALADWEIRVRRIRRLANCRARIAAECESKFVERYLEDKPS